MSESVDVLVTLGSNIAPDDCIPAAIRHLDRHDDLELRKVSAVYRSRAEGRPEQPDYHNAAVRLITRLSPGELRDALRAIEAELGRVRSDDRLAPRTIDLDIAFYGDQHIEDNGLIIPDPEVARRAYLAVPLADVDPDRIEPVSGRSLLDLASELVEMVRPVTRSEDRFPPDLDAVEGSSPELEDLVARMLVELEVDPTRRGLEQTPARVAQALDFLTSGYATTLEEVVAGAVFDEPVNEMVVLKDIEFYSLCEHHLLPFFGKASVGYLPRGRVLGVSRIARIVDLYARRLQVQERLVNQIADGLMAAIAPMGAGVVLEASHFCMMMRGVQKQGSSMITSAMRGTFAGDARTRAEFLELIRR